MYILTFDIEEWFHILDHAPTKGEEQWGNYESRLKANVDRLLDLLIVTKQPATFFCLGWIAKKYPEIIKTIHNAGFEIASHSHMHQLVYEQKPQAFQEDLRASVGILESITGRKVRAYRAPGFSIGNTMSWAFESMAACGIEIDSSVFPAPRTHGGFTGYGTAEPALITTGGITIKEFPINLGSVAGQKIVFSGGGYFRLFPLPAVIYLIKKSPYVMTYFHPRDFDAQQPIIPGLSTVRRFKSYYGLTTAFSRLKKILNQFSFVDIATAEKTIDWHATRVVSI